MFDLTFNAFSSFTAIMGFFMGLLCAAIGGLIVFYPLWQAIAWTRVKAKIVAVRANKSSFSEERNTNTAPAQPTATFSEEFKRSPGAGIGAIFMALFIVGIPLLFIGVGAYFALDYTLLKTQGIEAQGKIVRFEERDSDDGGSTYAPVVSYRDKNGINYTVTYRMSSSSRMGLDTGQKIKVFYDRQKPERFIIDHFWYNMVLPVAFIGMGSLFLLFMFFAGIRKANAQVSETKDAVTAQSNIYYPIYEYVAPNGQLIHAEGDGGSSMISNKIPGTQVTVLVKKSDYESPSQISLGLCLIGLVFLVPGFLILSSSANQFEFNGMFIAGLIAVLVMIGIPVAKHIKPRSQWEKKDEFRSRMKEKRAKKRAEGTVLSQAEFDILLKRYDRTILLWSPVYILITVAMIVGGYYLYNNQKNLMAGAMPARGEVIRLVSSSDSDGGTTYYPVISFTTDSGQRIEFKDNVGSNPPSARQGDVVSVLYDPADARKSAMVDRGWLNQLPGIGLMLFGAYLLFFSGRSFFLAQNRLNRSYAPLSR